MEEFRICLQCANRNSTGRDYGGGRRVEKIQRKGVRKRTDMHQLSTVLNTLIMHYRLGILYLKCLWMEVFLDFEFGGIYLYCMYIMRWESSLNRKFIYVSYVPYTHSLKVICYNVLNKFCTWKEVLWYKIFHLWCNVNAQEVSDFGAFRIWGLESSTWILLNCLI